MEGRRALLSLNHACRISLLRHMDLRNLSGALNMEDGSILQVGVEARAGPGGISPVTEPSRHRPGASEWDGPAVVCNGTTGYYLLYGTGEMRLCPLRRRRGLW